MGNKSRMTAAAHTNTDHNIREIQFGPHRTNPKLDSKQIWIPHGFELWLGRYDVSWKICGVVLVLVGKSLVTALSQASMPPPALDWESLKDDDLSENFLRITGSRPYVCIRPPATSQPSRCSNIWVRHICQIYTRYLSRICQNIFSASHMNISHTYSNASFLTTITDPENFPTESVLCY